MSEQRAESGLPPLHHEDFLEVGFDLIIDANVREAFIQIRNSNPELAREILLAAHYESTQDIESVTITSALRAHLGIVKAIERALGRDESSNATVIDADGEGSQPSVA